MTIKMKDITITKGTIDFGDWELTATGALGQPWEWRVENYNKAINYSSEWKMREYFSDREELEAFMWEEVQYLNKKYSHCAFEETVEQVEDEDYFEDED